MTNPCYIDQDFGDLTLTGLKNINMIYINVFI